MSSSVERKKKKTRIVCISDTHNHGPPSGFQLPKGDVLVHAGDLTNQGTYAEIERAVTWLTEAEFGVKIVVAGEFYPGPESKMGRC
jgi:predicted phosphodiesterase